MLFFFFKTKLITGCDDYIKDKPETNEICNMLSVAAMSTSDKLLATNFTPEVSITSNNKTIDIDNYHIKSEPDSDDSLPLEEEQHSKTTNKDDTNFKKEMDKKVSLKSESEKHEMISTIEEEKNLTIKMTDASPQRSAQIKPKTSFMTSHILGEIEKPSSVSSICQSSPAAVIPTSSITCSMASPNDSNFSSNEASPNSSNRGSVCSPTNSITSKTTSPMSSPPSSTFPQTHLLFQPFLPFNQQQQPQSQQHQSLLQHPSLKHLKHPSVPQMDQRPLPFSIDNILKPSFRRSDDEASAAVASHLFSPFLGASLATSILQHHHQQQQSLLQQAAAAHAVSAAVSAKAVSSSLNENSLSHLSSGGLGPYPPSAFNPRGGIVSPSSSSLSSPRSPPYPSPALPQLSSSRPKPFKIKQEPPPPARSPEKGTLPKEIVVRKKSTNTNQPVDLSKSSSSDENESQGKDDDVPPGMVRGPNGQLWPAWVFCTRYSDRPSSGK